MRVLAFGDSVTYGAGDSKGGWTDRLKCEFHQAMLTDTSKKESNHQLFNLGIGGDTSRDLLKRIDAEIQTRTKWPVAILIAIGTNDSRAVDTRDTFEVPIEEYEENMKKIIQIAKKYSNKILIIGLTPVSADVITFKNYWYFNSRIQQYNEALKTIANEEKLPFVELLETMKSSNTKDYFIDDGLHPNDSGYALMLKNIRPKVLELIDGINT